MIGFGPETLKSYEAGLKSQWFDNRVRANFAVFYEDYYGYQAMANLPQLCVDQNGDPLPAPLTIRAASTSTRRTPYAKGSRRNSSTPIDG